MTHLLYIHGFNSSPQSMKAELTKQYFAQHWPELHFYCPQIASNPNDAIAQLEQIISNEKNEQWLVMGSSLGGYFSTYLSEKYRIPAVLINPAVKPFELLSDYIGEQTNPYTEEVYQVLPEHIQHLKTLYQQTINKNNYLVMVQTGDEVLNYQEATEKYQECQLVVQQNGDHSFIDYDKMLPSIVDFFKARKQ